MENLSRIVYTQVDKMFCIEIVKIKTKFMHLFTRHNVHRTRQYSHKRFQIKHEKKNTLKNQNNRQSSFSKMAAHARPLNIDFGELLIGNSWRDLWPLTTVITARLILIP